jgi:hypothetical protein
MPNAFKVKLTSMQRSLHVRMILFQTMQLRHVVSGRCLTAADDKKSINLITCSLGDQKQEWTWFVQQ